MAGRPRISGAGGDAARLSCPTDGTEEDDPLRGKVKLNRVKHYLYEAQYDYEMSVTADAVQAARRANTWLFIQNYERDVPRAVCGAVRRNERGGD